MDRIRVLRLICFEGPRDLVEEQVRGSIHGFRKGIQDKSDPERFVTIQVETLGQFPEILEDTNGES